MTDCWGKGRRRVDSGSCSRIVMTNLLYFFVILNTDKVDREIEKLKKEQEELKQKISSETDETKIKQLESRLKQVKSELRQKGNDAYRRQYMVVS